MIGLYNNLICIGIIYLIWRFNRSWLIRLLSSISIIIYMITYTIMKTSYIQISNLNTANSICSQIESQAYNINTIDNFKNTDWSIYPYQPNKVLFKNLLALDQKHYDIMSDINNYLNIYYNSRAQYLEFDISKEKLRYMYILSYVNSAKNIDSNFYINVKAHGFYSDVSYLIIIDKLISNNQNAQAICMIKQLLNNAASRLQPSTILILKKVLISLICV